MENYYELALGEFEKQKNNLPISDGSIKSISTKTTVFAKDLEILDQNLANLGNNYISKMPEGSVEAEEIVKINKKFIEDYIAAYKTQ